MAGRLVWLAALLVPCAIAKLDCAGCHRTIYDAYRRTPMANSSGAAGKGEPRESFVRAEFRGAGFRYRVTPYAVAFDNGTLSGNKALRYFVGSGAVARSYLIESDGFLFQAPVTYYARDAKWELAPGYSGYGYPYLTRPILPGCLACHASGLKPVAGSQNRYQDPPFENGVTCERCHGGAETHDAIVNPAKLAPERRDSVCAQCHLSGEARVMRPGTDWSSYKPGGRLADSALTFVRADAAAGMTVTGHVEKLAQSACKKASGERLWCGSCHDAHTVDTAASYRAKCATCHEAAACRRGPDCTGCHMPKSAVTDAQHVVYTDHSIPRRPRAAVRPAGRGPLTLFGGGQATARDLGLAYAIAGDRERALPLLEKAEDREALVYLAEIYRETNRGDRGESLYRRALRSAPDDVSALVGLGAVLYERGERAEAIRLWQEASARNPGLVLARTNLAMAQWSSGDRAGARATLEGVIALSPGFGPAVELLRKLQ